jgi:hypothetical protein
MLEPPPRLRRDDVPRALSELLARTMSKSPAERPVSASEFGQELQRIQGGLGLPVTALQVATPPPATSALEATEQRASRPPLPPPVGGSASDEADPGRRARPAEGRDVEAAPPPVEIRAVGGDGEADGEGHTVTVGRPVVPAEEVELPTGARSSEASTRRVVVGTVAGVVCLLAVAASLLVFSRGGDGGGETTLPGPTTTQVVGLPPPTPQGVTVVRSAQGEGVVVAWQAVGEADSGVTYQVRQENPSGPVVNTDALSVTIEGVGPTERPCYVVIAISPRGQTSNESDLACLP